MRTYDVAQGEIRIAHVTVADDGQITWDFSPNDREGYWMSDATKAVIEDAIRAVPTTAMMVLQGFIIRQSTGESYALGHRSLNWGTDSGGQHLAEAVLGSTRYTQDISGDSVCPSGN